ncbi:hypothetical protein [Pontibacter harenae]|uniref:hypothetical protein n=1 Tax=Pontibacter harenae TaxID=2894083 RepID=UPI001E45B469|nr:hypothetical protein [Pontibacter harenae]MCC9167297.1 hypothetical protein [Pontibacter harenae]
MQEYSMFQKLPIRSQVETLSKNGIILAQRRHKQWLITLYSLGNAYVELWAGKEVEVIGMFHSSAKPMEVLEPYIDKIDVDDLIN